MADFSFIGQLQLHHHGTLDSVDHWHCCALPLGCRSTTVVNQRPLHAESETYRLLFGRDTPTGNVH